MIEKSKITVRSPEPHEYDILRKIYYDVRLERFSWLNKQKVKLTDFDESTQGELILAAIIKNQIAGFISVWENDSFIHNLFVLPQYRGFGIGKRLIEEVSKTIPLPLTLKCMKANRAAVAFYLSQSWTIEQEDTCEDGPYYLMKYAD